MIGKLSSAMQGLDERIRAQAAERAYGARQRQMSGIVNNFKEQMGAVSPDLGSVSAMAADLRGGDPADYMKVLQARGKRGDAGREDLYQQAAAASSAGPIARLNSMLAGTDAGSRAAQVGVYGGIGVGGGLGLTAAGQQLISLMQYMQQGQETNQTRDQELM